MTSVSADSHLNLAGREPLFATRKSVAELTADLVERGSDFRHERLSGIHNPWGLAGGITEPWAFLELCESAEVQDAARNHLGPDIILWDAELYLQAQTYRTFLSTGVEGRYWPVEPKCGALVLLSPAEDGRMIGAHALGEITPACLDGFRGDAPVLVVRLMPATSLFVRDPAHPAHRAQMEERVLLNYAERPLWLICGTNRANNDLVTGFAPPVPTWANIGESQPKE